jgi:tetratricopeptide (TPR) repeat protein
LIEENKVLAETHKSQGNEHFKAQEYQSAISCYQQALRYAPLDDSKLRAILYSNIAISLTKEDDHKDAIEYLKKSLKSVRISLIKDPTYAKAQLNLAIAYEKTDQPE